MLNKVVFRHQTIDFNYMADYVVLYELVEKFENLGLKAFLEHRCDWNDTIIRQFYATVEVNMEEESLEWMTGQRKYEATFREFATANELNYDFLTSASRFDISLEDPLSLNDIIRFYEPLRTGIPQAFEKVTGLCHHPAVIVKIARATVLAFVWWTRNFVKHVMDDEKVDVVNLIMHEIREKQTNFETNLYYAPYIMSLILDKTKFKGPCDVKHTSYKPFKNQPDFLNRELTPYLEGDQDVEYDDPEGDQAEGSGAHHDDQAAPPPPPPMHAQWEPPAGYFDSYFASMQQSLSSQIQQVQTGFADHFEAYGQQINNNF